MIRNANFLGRLAILGAGVLGCVQTATALPFTYVNNDLFLGFRKVGAYQVNNEVAVDIGSASNYLNLPIGTTITVPNVTPAQLVTGSFASYNNLSWSVVGYYTGSAYPGYHNYTLWMTVPRPATNVMGPPATRLDYGTQQAIHTQIATLFSKTSSISTSIGTSNQFNNSSFVLESSSAYPSLVFGTTMAGQADPTQGTLQDNWTEGNLEVATPNGFSGSVVSDIYEIVPMTDAAENTLIDPHTGTSSLAYYFGYFTLYSNGNMTFTRATTPPALTVTRTGNTSTISFGTLGKTTYSVIYTNIGGLNTSRSNWPSLGASFVGTPGGSTNISDTTADSSRVYSVTAH